MTGPNWPAPFRAVGDPRQAVTNAAGALLGHSQPTPLPIHRGPESSEELTGLSAVGHAQVVVAISGRHMQRREILQPLRQSSPEAACHPGITETPQGRAEHLQGFTRALIRALASVLVQADESTPETLRRLDQITPPIHSGMVQDRESPSPLARAAAATPARSIVPVARARPTTAMNVPALPSLNHGWTRSTIWSPTSTISCPSVSRTQRTVRGGPPARARSLRSAATACRAISPRPAV